MEGEAKPLLAAGVLGDSLGTFTHCVLRQLARQVESHSSLDLPTGNGMFFVVMGQAGCLRGNTLEYVVDERVHDTHGLGGDASVGVDLLHHFVDVDGVALLAELLLLALLSGRLRRLGGLLSFLASDFSGHFAKLNV